METYTGVRDFVDDQAYTRGREKTLTQLRVEMIDAPIVDIISGFNSLPYCYTIQSCYGHFVYKDQTDPQNLDPLPRTDRITEVEYRIAYICFCIQNNAPGHRLHHDLKEIPAMDPANIQFGCADWFWRRQVNSFVLQVEPERYKYRDTACLDYSEALLVEQTRNEFYRRLRRQLEMLKEDAARRS